MQNKETAIHFTKIARDKFQVYNFETKENNISNTRDLANYLVNLRGGITLDNAFYSRLISMPNFSTIAITKDALKIVKRASTAKIEPWKIEKSADGEVFVSAIDDEEDDKDLKKCASANLKHHYIISVKAKNENQKFMTYASLKKQACIPEANIAIEPVDNCVNFDYESEKNPYQVIQAIVDLLVATGVAVEPSQVECCHDFCNCGMDHVGPIVPCEENEFILDCYGEEPIIGQSLESLQSFASAHNKKHFKIYAYDKMVFDSDAVISRKAENENKNIFTIYIYSDTDNLLEQKDYHSFKDAESAFLPMKKEWAEKKENPTTVNYVKIKESDSNGKVINAWEGTDTGSLIPADIPAEGEVKITEPILPTSEKLEMKEEVEDTVDEPKPLPVGEKKEEIEEKVNTSKGQKLEEKVEETVQPKQASLKISAATREDIITWLKKQIDLIKDTTGEDLTLNTDFNNKIVVGGPTENILELEQLVNEKFNTTVNYNKVREKEMYFMVTTEPVEGMDGKTNLTIYINNQGDPTDAINRMSELNADPKVVVNKLETGDLLPGTEERKDGIKKLVNDKSKKEVVKDLKDKGHITEKEIEDVKKDDIEKKSNTNISGKTLDELIANLEKEGYTIKDFQPGLPKALVSAEKDGKKFNIEVSTMLNDDENNDHRVTNIKEHTEITTDDNIEKESKVVKQDGKYQAQSEKGKNFGTYDTKEEAKERVKQMEMFKHMNKKSAASNLIGVTITYDNGDVITTDVNGNQTDEQIKEYFKVGKEFNLGNGEKDNMAKVVKVDIDRGNIEKEAVEEFILNDAQKKYLANEYYPDCLDYYLDKNVLAREWKFTKDNQDSDKHVYPYRFVIEGEFHDAIGESLLIDVLNNVNTRKEASRKLGLNKKAEMDEAMINDVYLWTVNTGYIYDSKILPTIKALARHLLKGDYSNERAIDAWMYTVEEGLKDYAKHNTPGADWHALLSVEERREVAKNIAEYFFEDVEAKKEDLASPSMKNTLDADIEKEAEKVLIDKITNQPIKPGDTTEGKELKEVEVEKTASPIYKLFMKSATIEVNKNELALLTAAYNSPMFQKLAYLGPTSFAFKDKDTTFVVENNMATCHKTADFAEDNVKKEANPISLEALTDAELQAYIKHLNSKYEVK